MKLPSRRAVLLGSAGVGAVSLGLGGYAALATPYDFFRGMLRAELPGVNVPDDAIKAFVGQAFNNRQSDFAPKLKALSAATRLCSYEGVRAALGNTFAFQKFRRDLLTDFLLGSDFFDHGDPEQYFEKQPAHAVAFFGIGGYCRNRFARFNTPT